MSTESDKGVVEFPVKGSARPTGDLPPPEGPIKPPSGRPSNELPERREAGEARSPIIEPREEAGTHAAEPGTPTRPSGEPLVPERDVVTPQDAADDAATIERRPVGIHAHEWPPLVTTYKETKETRDKAPARDDKDRVRTRDGLLVQKVDVESRERNKKEREDAEKKAREASEAREKKAREAREKELATA